MMSYDPLKPDVKLLSKLGSMVIHIEEAISAKGHPFDMVALKAIIESSEVKQWLQEMDKLALIPVKR